MNDTSKQEFHRKALATAIATALMPAMAYGAAGRVDFAYGDVKGVDTAGQERRLTKGAEINQGDTVITARGRAQIRFTDGARTSLLPNSEFKVETYEFEEQAPQEAKGFFSLLKGGLRTITGAIGRLRQDAYQVTTPVATIGIRGTEYLVVLGNSASIWVGDGTIVACNAAGCTKGEGGTSLFVANANTRALVTDQKPDTTIDSVVTPLDPFIAGDDPTLPLFPRFQDSPAFGGPNAENGAFYALAVSVGDSVEGSGSSPASAKFLGGVVLTNYSGRINGSINTNETPVSVEAVVNGEDNSEQGLIGWGRWFNGAIQSDVDNGGYGGGLETLNLFGSQGHHYAIGIAATDIPASGEARYDFLGGTPPGYADGLGSGTLNSAALNVDFGTQLARVDLGMSLTRSDTGVTDNFNVTNAVTGLNENGTFSYSGGSSTTTGTACPCYSYVEGFLAGPQASRAGLAYQLYTDHGYLNGAAGFQKGANQVGLPVALPMMEY